MARVWETTDPHTHQDFKSNDRKIGSVRSIAFSPDGAFLLAADDSDSGQAGGLVWDAPGNPRWVAPGTASAASAAFAGAVPVFAVAGKAGVRCYSVPTFQPLGNVIPTTREPDMIAVSPNGRFVAVKLDSRILLHDAVSGELRHAYTALGNAWTLAFTPDGKNLISGHTDKVVRVWAIPGNL
jgi:WD40 repeat protein